MRELLDDVRPAPGYADDPDNGLGQKASNCLPARSLRSAVRAVFLAHNPRRPPRATN